MNELSPAAMTDQHPITPPPELVQQWASEFYGTAIAPGEASIAIATQAARWGADHWSSSRMTELSPAAKAVLDAASGAYEPNVGYKHKISIAAALRAAADQLLAVEWNGQIPADTEHQLGINWARDALHVLANELEAH